MKSDKESNELKRILKEKEIITEEKIMKKHHKFLRDEDSSDEDKKSKELTREEKYG